MARANKKAEEEESDAVKDVSMRRKKSRAAIEGVAADLRAETEAISKAASAGSAGSRGARRRAPHTGASAARSARGGRALSSISRALV